MAYRYDRRIAMTVSPAEVEKWKSDLRRMTKIYKSIPAAPEEKQLELFTEARELFGNFRKNFEEWVYDALLPSKDRKKQNFTEQEVAKTTWNALISFSGMFPDSWNPKTDKHEPAPWQLARDIDRNITRYQRAFNIAFKDIDKLLELRGGEGKTVELHDPVEHFNLGPLHIILHNQGRTDHGEKELEIELHTLTEATERISKAGFPEAVRGLTVHISFVAPSGEGMTAGMYTPSRDELNLYPLGTGYDLHDRNHTFIHECGHRFYFRSLGNNARAHWDETIDNRVAIITEEDVKDFVKRYLRPFFERRTYLPGPEEVAHDLREESVETEAKYRYLASHIPIMDGKGGNATPDSVLSFWLSGGSEMVGSRVNLEHITDYGATDAREAFAEAFRLYVSKGPGAVAPWTRQFFEAISRAGGAKFAARGSSFGAHLGMSDLAKRVAERVTGAAEITNLPRLERIITSIESEAKQMVAAFKKYKEDPERYKPQLSNIEHGASIISSDIRVLLRTLGKDE